MTKNILRNAVIGLTSLALSTPVSAQVFEVAIDNLDGTSRQVYVEKTEDGYQELAEPTDAQLKSGATLKAKTLGQDNSMPSIGEPSVAYFVVEFQDTPNPMSILRSREHMDAIDDAYFRVSKGNLDINMWGPHPIWWYSKFEMPYDMPDECTHNLMHEIADYVDEHLDAWGYFPISDVDTRVYFMPPAMNCPFGGLGTLNGTPSLPLANGKLGNRSWVLGDYLMITMHELGHNLGRHHANEGSPDNILFGIEYGDPSCIMGRYACEIVYDCYNEMRGFNGPHASDLGWAWNKWLLDPHVELTVSKTEAVNPEFPQVFRIPLPGSEDRHHLTFSYRTGEDGRRPDGSVPPLHPDFSGGLSIHFTNNNYTIHYDTLRDGDISSTPDWWNHEFYTVQQLYSDQDTVTFRVDIDTTFETMESRLKEGACNDGIDNDFDDRGDFTGINGLPPEGISCAFKWDSLEAPDTAVAGDFYEAVCTSQYENVPYVGPMTDGVQDMYYEPGRGYVSLVLAPAHCGTTQTIQCSSPVEGFLSENTPEKVVEIGCRTGYVCNKSNECEPTRIRRGPTRRIPN